MAQGRVENRGWGSPSKRPHSWVASYSDSYHQGSGTEHLAPSSLSGNNSVNNSPSHRRHKGYKSNMESPVSLHNRSNIRHDFGCGTGKAIIRNLRCRSLVDRDDVMYKCPPPPSKAGMPQGYSQFNKYTPTNNCHSNTDAQQCQRNMEVNSNFYGSLSYGMNYSERYYTYAVDPYSDTFQSQRPNPGLNGVSDRSVCNSEAYSKSIQGYNYNPNNNIRLSPQNNNNPSLDYNVNQLEWSPEKVSSAGSSFDSGYQSNTGSNNNNGNHNNHKSDLRPAYNSDVSYRLDPDRVNGSPNHVSYRPPVHQPYQLSQRADCYQSGIKRTLDKCEDRCVQEVHPSQIWAEQQSEWESIVLVKYIGSFSVIGEDQSARADYVRKQLLEMRNVTKTKPVLLVISLSGIKVCSSTGESVYMAHALKRISYATCDPDFYQFSFLAREPKGHTNIQYCHAFVTRSAQEAEELNAIVGNAFKMAFTYQRERQQQTRPPDSSSQPDPAPESQASPPPMMRQPTFHELIEQQIEVQREQNEVIHKRQQEELTKRLSEISTPKVDERIKELNERRKKDKEDQDREVEVQRQQRLQGKDRTSWAKHVAGRAKHKSPLRNNQPGSSTMGDPQSKHTSSPQLHRQASNSSATITAANGSTPTTSTTSPALKPSPFSSISALRDAFNAGELRQYGSPVMTLKETIDKIHWSGHFAGRDSLFDEGESGSDTGQNGMDFTDGALPPGEAFNRAIFYDSEPGSASSQISNPPDFSQRPLPATPPEVQRRTKTKGQRSSNQKSSPPRPDPDSCQSPPSSRPQSNGHVQTNTRRSRPTSGKYQNESPMHTRSIEMEEPSSGDLYQGPPTPLRYDSLRKIDRSDAPIEEDLKSAPWYQTGIPREIALEMLTQEEIGSFVVRDSTTHPGCYALSVKVPKFDNPSGISHYLITRTSHGAVKLKGLDKEWSSLTALVTHHSVMRELLPCTLRLPRNSNNPAFNDDDDKGEQEEDEDYQRLADFSHMMQDLKM